MMCALLELNNLRVMDNQYNNGFADYIRHHERAARAYPSCIRSATGQLADWPTGRLAD